MLVYKTYGTAEVSVGPIDMRCGVWGRSLGTKTRGAGLADCDILTVIDGIVNAMNCVAFSCYAFGVAASRSDTDIGGACRIVG
jgi:hypothetical protein